MMTKRADQVIIFVTIAILLSGCATVAYAYIEPPDPRIHVTRQPTATVTPSPTPTLDPQRWQMTPTAVVGYGGKAFGWTGQIACYDCTPFNQRVRLTHYNPLKGDINCWEWSEDFQWCMSETASGVPWESAWGFGAACPIEWPFGTWVEIPGVGSFVCLDRGDMVVCNHETGICAVDLLGPGGQDWDGSIVDVMLWVPLKPRW